MNLLLGDAECTQHHPNVMAPQRAKQTDLPRRCWCCCRVVQVEMDHRILHAALSLTKVAFFLVVKQAWMKKRLGVEREEEPLMLSTDEVRESHR